MADAHPLDRVTAEFDPRDLDATLALARDLVRNGQWSDDIARVFFQGVTTLHGDAGENRLIETIDQAGGD
ncbi:MAG TPA: hypothetical protein VKA53_10680 [Thermoanaerobaculia bacterium]|nr:hypothetical protein [Thermoanaerobaculia bacterium]